MTYFWIMLVLLSLQRIVELMISANHVRWLISQGGYEVGATHYKYMVMMHITWFASMILEFFLSQSSAHPEWYYFFSVLIITQIGRYVVIATLGKFWTTRVFVVPHLPLVRDGVYRFIKHPNYWIVSIEIALFPLLFQLYLTSIIFSILNFIILAVRIGAEETALKQKDHAPSGI